jgi:hypothetical protein
LEDRQVLAIESLSLLGNPGEGESALEATGDLYLLLATESQGFGIAEVEEVVGDGDELVLLVFEK